jgi:voltage-gated potassium channel
VGIVTLATVGYGDVVPHTAWGRVVGGAVIVIGVTFLSFLTATITSYFVAAEEEAAALKQKEEYIAAQAQTAEALRRLEDRLATIAADVPTGGSLRRIEDRLAAIDARLEG